MTAVLSETAHHRTQGVELVSPDFSPVDHPQDAAEQVRSLEVKPCSPQDSKHLLPATKRHPQGSYDDALKGSDVTKYSAGGFNVVALLYNPPATVLGLEKPAILFPILSSTVTRHYLLTSSQAFTYSGCCIQCKQTNPAPGRPFPSVLYQALETVTSQYVGLD